MNLRNIKYYCTTNGAGFRTAVFVSGCNIHCPGCFNKIAWDFNSGFEMTEEVIDKILISIEPEYISGLSILGGEPMDVKNQPGVAVLIHKFRQKFGDKKDIWMWSGYILNDNMPQTEFSDEILKNVDYLVDGPYKHELADIKLLHKGSSNQRVLQHTDNEFVEICK